MPFLLDTTLRDGSNAINFQFTLEHVRKIVSSLSLAQVDFIEVCNGGGIGAHETHPHFFTGLFSDAEYLKTARQSIKGKSKLGAIASPSLAREEFLDPIWEWIDFLRVAVDLNDAKGVHELIAQAKRRNKIAFVQLMRSSMVAPQILLQQAQEFAQCGADAIYIVDSGGVWTPAEVEGVMRKLKSHLSVPIGFHGHNHMQLAVGNSLAALAAGADYVDGCLLTLGNGVGNAQTEILALLLNRMYGTNYDVHELIQIAESEIEPLLKGRLPGTNAFHMENVSRRIDCPKNIAAEIQKVTGFSLEEVLDTFQNIPNFYQADEASITLVVHHLLAQQKNRKTA